MSDEEAGSLFIIVAIFVVLISACVFSDGCSKPKKATHSNESSWDNASDEVKEDVLIYQVLRQQGYSDAEAKRAVIDSL